MTLVSFKGTEENVSLCGSEVKSCVPAVARGQPWVFFSGRDNRGCSAVAGTTMGVLQWPEDNCGCSAVARGQQWVFCSGQRTTVGVLQWPEDSCGCSAVAWTTMGVLQALSA